MAKRQNVKTIDSSIVQGEGSTVMLRRVTVGEMKKISAAKAENESDSFQLAAEVIVEHVLSWNWVDEEGVALPIPKVDNTVIDKLTDEEFKFLAEAIRGSAEDQKK